MSSRESIVQYFAFSFWIWNPENEPHPMRSVTQVDKDYNFKVDANVFPRFDFWLKLEKLYFSPRRSQSRTIIRPVKKTKHILSYCTKNSKKSCRVTVEKGTGLLARFPPRSQLYLVGSSHLWHKYPTSLTFQTWQNHIILRFSHYPVVSTCPQSQFIIFRFFPCHTVPYPPSTFDTFFPSSLDISPNITWFIGVYLPFNPLCLSFLPLSFPFAALQKHPGTSHHIYPTILRGKGWRRYPPSTLQVSNVRDTDIVYVSRWILTFPTSPIHFGPTVLTTQRFTIEYKLHSIINIQTKNLPFLIHHNVTRDKKK